MSRHRGRAHGRILEVTEETIGSVLVADAAAGATVLYVDDAADFEDDGTGGWLEINDQVVQYTDVDDDAGIITITTGLAAAADQGDRVDVWSRLYDAAATLKTALVQVDGEDDNTDPIVATLGDAVQDLPEGLRGDAGENCTLHQVSADEWEVTAVGGRPSSTKGASSIRFCDTDTFTTKTAGAQSFQLSHEPIDGSVHMIWNGLDQPHSQSSIAGQNVTVPDSGGLIQPGDVIDFKYAYRVGVATPAYSLEWGSAGWSYLQVARTDSVDRSAVAFDDSGWAVGQAPFGTSGNTDWPLVPVTAWALDTALWMRRHITIPAGNSVTVELRVDNYAQLYWNGTLIYDSGTTTPVKATVTVPASALVDGDNVLALHATDDGPSTGPDNTYADARISWSL